MNYYACELNQFIAENCTREMIAVNIDCVCVKFDKVTIRFIESKHTNEKISSEGQRLLLEILSGLEHENYYIENFVVYGDYPYLDGAKVVNLITGEESFLTRKKLIAWLNFEVVI